MVYHWIDGLPIVLDGCGEQCSAVWYKTQKMHLSSAQAGLGFRLPGDKMCVGGGSDSRAGDSSSLCKCSLSLLHEASAPTWSPAPCTQHATVCAKVCRRHVEHREPERLCTGFCNHLQRTGQFRWSLHPAQHPSLLDEAPDKAMNFSLDTILYKLTNTENRLVVARVRQGGMDWEFGINRYKWLDREWIKKVLPESTGNSMQCLW